MIRAETITETSWQELVRAVKSYIGRRVSNPEDRDDLVQDVLLRIHRGLDGLKGQASLGPWVYSIASNAVVDYWRRRGKRPAAVPLDRAGSRSARWPPRRTMATSSSRPSRPM